MENLFSYGTLQYPSVQQNSFGRLLEGERDYLLGYKIEQTKIEDATVVATSGDEYHPIAIYTGNVDDSISGMVFSITKEELQKSDAYEVSQYKRVGVKLKSGKDAWVYVR
ncbi:MAG: gamma-glutamylcyclotransferase family protein [bacterium]